MSSTDTPQPHSLLKPALDENQLPGTRSQPKAARFYLKALDVLWIAALVGLPLTTFPIFADLTGAVVAPFSGGPILLMLLAWLLPALLLKRQRLPLESKLLAVFVFVAMLSTVVSLFIQLPTLKGASPPRQELRAMITLGVGMAFYLVCASWPRDEQKLRRSLQWINIGGLVLLVWTLTQMHYILTDPLAAPGWIDSIEEFLVFKTNYFAYRGERTSGLAYEPSWFAHQLVILYIPLWLAATYERKSVFNFRILGLSVENILLPLSLVEFILSSPRVGLLSALLMIVLLFVRMNVSIIQKITTHILQRSSTAQRIRLPDKKWSRISIAIPAAVLLIFGYTALAFLAIYLLSQRDWRLALLFTKPPTLQEVLALITLQERALVNISVRLAFLERVVYWLSGWDVFNAYPWLGVGLGNASFFFLQKVQAVGWSSYEIRAALNAASGLQNIKSFWVRLLAETGVLGFYVFLSWLNGLRLSARAIQRSKLPEVNQSPTWQILALAAQLSLVAFIGEGFSIDSFAMPYLWVITGLLSAGGMAYRSRFRSESTSGSSPQGSLPQPRQ